MITRTHLLPSNNTMNCIQLGKKRPCGADLKGYRSIEFKVTVFK